MSDEHIRVPQQYVTPPYYSQQTPPEPPQPPHGWSGGAVVAAAVAGSIVGGILMAAAMLLVFGAQPSATQQQQSTTAPSASIPATNSELLTGDQPIEAVAARVTPSVVNVAIEQSVTNPFTGAGSTQIVGNGSGVVIRSDGYILTNNHVVSGASKILVTIGLNNVPAKVVGADSASDIAVVKVDKTALTAATLGDSEALKVGEEVVAVGSPFGLDKTVTSGIISALHRTGSAQDTQQSQLTIYPNLIQTDAPINPGNSGGALCDLTGRVVGINTLIQTGGAQQSAGIGFSIPINLAKQVADQLIATGKATHTFLGVSAQDVTAQNAAQLGVKVTAGALVQDVQPTSPAAKAGLKRGDVITKVGSAVISNSQDMVAAVRSHNPGDKVAVVVDRSGKTLTIEVTLGSST